MPDDLYDRDVLEWSERQADLLRRVANGERVNEVDWANVIEEIEDVGNERLNAVHSYLRQAMIHLLKLHLMPADEANRHWFSELGNFLDDAEQRFTPSMRQRIELATVYRKARTRVLEDYPEHNIIEVCPWTLDELLTTDRRSLLSMLASGSSGRT